MRFAIGPCEISVFRRPELELGHTLAHFEVDDIVATVRDLEAGGVTFVGRTTTDRSGRPITSPASGRRGAPGFRDPDGNYLGLRQADPA